MGWCLKCHRDPTPNLRPKEDVTNMGWGLNLKDDEVARLHAIGFTEAKVGSDLSESDRRAIGKLLFDRYQIRDRIEMADCSKCHR